MRYSFGGFWPVLALVVSGAVAPTAHAQRYSDPDTLAPAFPTPQAVVEHMLSIAQVKPGETVYDLGCGDGRIVIMAAQRFKAHATGIDADRAARDEQMSRRGVAVASERGS